MVKQHGRNRETKHILSVKEKNEVWKLNEMI